MRGTRRTCTVTMMRMIRLGCRCAGAFDGFCCAYTLHSPTLFYPRAKCPMGWFSFSHHLCFTVCTGDTFFFPLPSALYYSCRVAVGGGAIFRFFFPFLFLFVPVRVCHT